MLRSRLSIENIVKKIEEDAVKELGHDPKLSRIKELHQSVPENLKIRLEKILPEEIFYLDNVFELDETQLKEEAKNLNKEIEKLMPTLDDVLEERDLELDEVFSLMQQVHKDVELDIEEPPKTRRINQKEINWIAEYVKQLKSHRVKWNSKLYRDDPKKWFKKPLIENVEFMVNLAADEFAEWCNSLASDKSKTITRDLIKQLFAIEIEGSAPLGTHIEPTDLHIVPSEILKKFDPHLVGQNPLEVERKMKRIQLRDKIENNKPEANRAFFGHSLPVSMKHTKRIQNVKEIKPYFPQDLATKEALFKGIEHLQVTREVVEHIKEQQEFEVPKYLKTNPIFNASQIHTNRSSL